MIASTASPTKIPTLNRATDEVAAPRAGSAGHAMPCLVMMTTDPFALRAFAFGHLAHFTDLGYNVIAVSRPTSDLALVAQREKVTTIAVPMEREFRPWADLVSLVRIYRLFRRLRPTIVNAGTPKAGLLGMLAAWLARVPVRVYTVHGLRLETTHGLKRRVLAMAERVASLCATRVVCVGESLRAVYLNHGLARSEKTCVLWHGSFNGIHAQDFSPTDANRAAGKALRAKLGIPAEATVIGFIGRLVRDKGIVELLGAFNSLASQFADAWLLIGGNFEPGDPVPPEQVRLLKEHPRVVLAGFVDDSPPFYHATDLIAMPTYREGFPYVPLEAAAAGLSVVGFRVTGMIDAVQEGVSGTLVPVGDARQLAEALARYLADPALRARHGEAGRQRVSADFRPQDVWRAWDAEYSRLMQECGLAFACLKPAESSG